MKTFIFLVILLNLVYTSNVEGQLSDFLDDRNQVEVVKFIKTIPVNVVFDKKYIIDNEVEDMNELIKSHRTWYITFHQEDKFIRYIFQKPSLGQYTIIKDSIFVYDGNQWVAYMNYIKFIRDNSKNKY